MTVLAAVFNGDPAGPGPDDPQSRKVEQTTHGEVLVNILNLCGMLLAGTIVAGGDAAQESTAVKELIMHSFWLVERWL